MINLIRFELRKNNLIPYFYGVCGIFTFAFLLGILFSAIPIIEPNDTSSKMFNDKTIIITMISIICMSAFSILSAVMYAKFIIEEYTGRKNVLIFTYPQKRSNILFAKFIFVSSFVFVTMFISTVLCCLFVGFIGSVIGIISEPLMDITYIIQLSLLLALVSNFIGLIALRVGFYKKSIIIPVVTAIILSAPFGNFVALLGENVIVIILSVTALLCVTSTILFFGLLRKVNRMDCI